jgi:hypothetical protein
MRGKKGSREHSSLPADEMIIGEEGKTETQSRTTEEEVKEEKRQTTKIPASTSLD